MTKSPLQGKKILVIPDAHAHPDVSQDRFHWLGKFIVDKKPDIVISIGDWADMQSLSHYDKGTTCAEGKRYTKDIDASNEALDITMGYVNAEISRIVRNKKRAWKPEFHITLGNHENRINTAQKQDPRMHGAIGTSDLNFEEYGWNVVPFLQPLVKQNICFQHYLVSGVMGRAVSGVNHARSLYLKGHMSTVVGHSHMYSYSEDVRADKNKIFGLVVGCYEDLRDHTPNYATHTAHHWWSGLVMLHNAHDGSCDPARYSFDYLQNKYG